MKRIIALLLVLVMFVSITACDRAGGNGDDTNDIPANSDQSGALDNTDEPTEPYEGIFRVGYSRKDISPDKDAGVLLGDRTVTKIQDPVYATCVAVNDGENTVLIYTADIRNMDAASYKATVKKISSATKVPEENIMIAPTHNHTSLRPDENKSNPANSKWVINVFNKNMVEAGKEAIADLSDSEIRVSTGKTTGMAFVRRYLLADGTYTGIQTTNTGAKKVAYESEADDTVQVIRFVREDKKDVVMANWQAHVAHASSLYGTYSISSDFVGFARDTVESLDDDTLFAMYIGASGNINLSAEVPGTKKYSDFTKVGKALGEVIVDSFDNMTKVQAGEIKISHDKFTADVRKDSASKVEQAKKVYDSKDQKLMQQYGFVTMYDAEYTVFRNTKLGATDVLPIAAISFGDLAFVTVPYEMFDTNGMEVKDDSPFKMTFILSNAGDAKAYVPSALAVPHGGYEVYTTHYVFGTGEKMVEALLALLNTHVEQAE